MRRKSTASGRSSAASSRTTRVRTEQKTGYAACYLDEHDSNNYGVYRVFRSRAKCLDFLTDAVFLRAEALGVEVVDTGGKLEARDGRTCYPLMTREEVRDHFGGGYDFGRVLEYDCLMNPTVSADMGVREVEIE